MSQTAFGDSSFALPPWPRLIFPALVLALAVGLALHLGGLPNDGREIALSALLGLVFGVLLQRSRFCFFCVTRDFLDQRDARGLLGIVAALVVGTLGYHLVFGAFLPVPAPGRLPPDAHVGPLSWVLGLGAFSFGIGMAISGSCISAHLYRLGEGALASPLALIGAGIGFIAGFASWNTLYLHSIQQAPVVWLPNLLGYGGSLGLQLAVLAALALWLAWRHRRPAADQAAAGWWQRRWPAYAGGILIGTLAALAYLRVGPLGVTAELGSLARTVANTQGWLPARLEGLDTFSGCATVIKETLWSRNGAFVISLILGAFASALLAGEFKPTRPSAGALVRALAGGVLMGWGSMLALGCTVGTLLSGIMAGAVSGWLFAVFALAGLWLGWRARQRLGWV